MKRWISRFLHWKRADVPKVEGQLAAFIIGTRKPSAAGRYALIELSTVDEDGKRKPKMMLDSEQARRLSPALKLLADRADELEKEMA